VATTKEEGAMTRAHFYLYFLGDWGLGIREINIGAIKENRLFMFFLSDKSLSSMILAL